LTDLGLAVASGLLSMRRSSHRLCSTHGFSSVWIGVTDTYTTEAADSSPPSGESCTFSSSNRPHSCHFNPTLARPGCPLLLPQASGDHRISTIFSADLAPALEAGRCRRRCHGHAAIVAAIPDRLVIAGSLGLSDQGPDLAP